MKFGLKSSSYKNCLYLHLVSFSSFISLHKIFILLKLFFSQFIDSFIHNCFLEPKNEKEKGNFLDENLEIFLL